MTADERIELESRIAHQDLQIEKLLKVSYEQELRIDRLEKVVKELVNVIKSGQIGPGNEKPPHY